MENRLKSGAFSEETKAEFTQALAEAEEDVRSERVAPLQTSFDDLRAMLKGG